MRQRKILEIFRGTKHSPNGVGTGGSRRVPDARVPGAWHLDGKDSIQPRPHQLAPLDEPSFQA